jgi:argininosuccinate synthase
MNAIAGNHGVGRLDMIEDRMIGVKSRECYETPAATALIIAHKALETMCLERETLFTKLNLEHQWAHEVYFGKWFSPLKQALDAFMAETQRFVTGVVKIKFYKGNATVVGMKSDVSLYDFCLASYGAEDTFDRSAAKGFIDLTSLPISVWAGVQGAKVE